MDNLKIYGQIKQCEIVQEKHPDFVVSDTGILAHVGNGMYEMIIPKDIFVEAIERYYCEKANTFKLNEER